MITSLSDANDGGKRIYHCLNKLKSQIYEERSTTIRRHTLKSTLEKVKMQKITHLKTHLNVNKTNYV